MNMTVVDLIEEALALEAKITKIQSENIKPLADRLAEIKKQMPALATHKGNQATGYIVGAGLRCKVVLNPNDRKFDDAKLDQIAEAMPASFAIYFEPKPGYKHKGKQLLDQLLAPANVEDPMARAVRWAMTEKPVKPTVTFERVEEDSHGA
jgi:hypothetical protein